MIEDSISTAVAAAETSAVDAVVRRYIATHHPHLCEFVIVGDHHCLFNSVIDQIRTRRIESTLPMDQVGLRHAVAVEMRALLKKHALGAEFITLARADAIDSRDKRRELHTIPNTEWGGDAELFMICYLLKRPVFVATMGFVNGAPGPVLCPVGDCSCRYTRHCTRRTHTK